VNEREPIRKSVRFEVFKRDSFTCQYCGASAPNVVLQVDHIKPVASGGTNDLLNLITSCQPCNSGKSDRELSDDSVVARQKAQLDALQERREQLDMMMEWQTGLADLEDEAARRLSAFWEDLVPGDSLDAGQLQHIRRLITRHSFGEVAASIRTAAAQYLVMYDDGVTVTSESAGRAFSALSGICRMNALDRSNPGIKELHYIKGIARKRLSLTPARTADIFRRLVAAHERGVSVESLRRIASTARGCRALFDGIDEAPADDDRRREGSSTGSFGGSS
jgi:hypothetical protein